MLARVIAIRAAAAAIALVPAAGLARPAAAASPPPIVRPAHPSPSSVELGRQLFAANCSTCHGSAGQGVQPGAPAPGANDINGEGPPLIGVGSLSTDFYLRTGYMPLGDPTAQPERTRPQLSDPEIRAVERYVDSLSPTPGPGVPRPLPQRGSLSEGLELFTEHCAGCHQVAAAGGVVTGARVPPLSQASPTQIAEAVRIGPYVMPSFSKRDITDAQLNSIVRYVRYAAAPEDPGGWPIGHLGPFSEGLVSGAVAVVVLVGLCVIIGERARRPA